MQKLAIYFTVIILCGSGCHRSIISKGEDDKLFTAVDHTAENLFSGNIEGPAVDQQGRLFVVNYLRDGTIGLVQPNGEVELFVELPAPSIGNSIQFLSNGNMLVADFKGHKLWEVDMDTRKLSIYCADEGFNQPNDICISSKEIVYASDPDWASSSGQVWKIGPDRRAEIFSAGMGTTNGICLSPDEKILYVNESVQRNIWAFDLDEEGNSIQKRLFATVSDHGFDGMKTDTRGNLYVTRYGKGTIAIFNPAGILIREVKMQGKKTSNICFGGENYKTAFVTLQDRKGIERFYTDIPGKQTIK